MKDQLIFDVTDANTIAESDSVGAFLRASDGTLLTHTDVGGKKALDVRLAEGVDVEVDLSHIDDSVRLGDGTSFFTSTSENGDIALDVHISNTEIAINDGGNSLTVDGTVAATQSGAWSVDAVQSGTWNIGTVTTLTGITNDVNIADGGNSITVDAVDFDIRDLTAASDSVQSNLFDGAGTALTSTLVGADQALDVNLVNTVSIDDVALADTAIVSTAKTLTAAATAETVVTSALSSRKYLYIYNNDNRKMYIGGSGVDKDNGFPVSPGSYIEMRAGASSAVYFDSEKTGHAIRTLELS